MFEHQDRVVLAEGRAIGAMVHVPGCATFCVLSLYLHHSEGLSEANLSLLKSVCVCVWGGGVIGNLECEFIIAADWNSPPGTLSGSGFPAKANGVVVSAQGRARFP
eukprot:2779778-Pyramimonas_sp.AAC.1